MLRSRSSNRQLPGAPRLLGQGSPLSHRTRRRHDRAIASALRDQGDEVANLNEDLDAVSDEHVSPNQVQNDIPVASPTQVQNIMPVAAIPATMRVNQGLNRSE